MRLSGLCAVRGGGRSMLSGIFGAKKTSVAGAQATQLTEEQQNKLRGLIPSLRTDEERKRNHADEAVDFSSDEVDSRVDMDMIRARSVMKYRYTYTPPKDVETVVLQSVKKVTGTQDQHLSFSSASEKAAVLLDLSQKLRHGPTNSRLVHLKTVSDVIEFYSQPVKNTNSFVQLARSSTLPKNVSILEQPTRFNPEDSHAWHGGVTAYPGTGGEVVGLRNKRLLRQYRPKNEWFDYEEQAFDYTRHDKGMPWDPEIARRMDRYPDKKMNLKSKTFVRAN